MPQPTTAEILQYVTLLGYTQGALALLSGGVVCSLQIGAFHRHGTPSFLLLTISTICGILMLVLGFVPHFFPSTPILSLWFYLLSFLFFCAEITLGIFGIVMLFQEYRKLAEASAKS